MRASSVEQIILEVLSKEHAHLTSLQVYEDVRRRLPAVHPSTVYRALERLANAGKVSVSDMGAGAAVYELLTDGYHHHLVCQRCLHVVTLADQDVRNFFAAVEAKNRFSIKTNHLILFGICDACQDEPNPGRTAS